MFKRKARFTILSLSYSGDDNYLAKHAPVTRTTPLVSNAQLQNIGIGESAPLPMSTGNDGKDTVDNDLKAKRNPNVDIDWESAKEGDLIYFPLGERLFEIAFSI